MLQSQTITESPDDNVGLSLSPGEIKGIVKRRVLYFIIPFLILAALGTLGVLAWPATYRSEGKILVQSPEIPTDLVRPTVVSFANERVQVLEQRVMTRDNLLALANKFHLDAGWRARLSGTEIVDFIRARTLVTPVEVRVAGGQRQAIAFDLGFIYEKPQIAMQVANELLTMFLREDARTRTSSATETTKFIQANVNRLEAQLGTLDTQIAEAKYKLQQQQQDDPTAVSDTAELGREKALSTLRQMLLIKSATYSADHPDIKELKRRIAALEKKTKPDAKSDPAQTDKTSDDVSKGRTPLIDTLFTKRASLRKELESATEKLAVARLGESLERGQYSARLQVLEQPTLPTKPASPNRPKLLAMVFAAALMAGGGLAVAAEMLDSSVRSTKDLFSLVDSHLVVAIPYIATQREKRRKLTLILLAIAIFIGLVAGVVALFLFVLPPPETLIDKALTVLFRYI